MTQGTSKIDYERTRAVRSRREQSYASNPASAITTKHVTVKLIDTYHKVGEARGFRVESDEPESVGGGNVAPQPTEFMLMSLAFCQMSIIVSYAVAMHVDLDDVEINVTGTRDSRGLLGLADVRPGYYQIQMETKLYSNAPKERLQKLVEVAEQRCPVYDNLRNPTAVSNRVTRGDDLLLEMSLQS